MKQKVSSLSLACEYSRITSGLILSRLREASVIRAEKFHTDDVNMPRIQASLPNGYSSLYSCIISKIIFVWIKMVDSVNCELTVAVLSYFLCKEQFGSDARIDSAYWCHQYGIFQFELQTQSLGGLRIIAPNMRQLHVFTGYTEPCMKLGPSQTLTLRGGAT